jgi:replicative DNA helicase
LGDDLMVEVAIEKNVLLNEVYISESLLVATIYNKPSLFDYYTVDKLSRNHFGNKIWKFYFGLAREMYKKGIQVFDDIAVGRTVKEGKAEKLYTKYGEFDTIDELMFVTKGAEENFETYYEDVKKYSLLRGLEGLLGDKIIKKTPKYDYHKMTRQEIEQYWYEKLMLIQNENSDTKIKEYNLLGNMNELINKLDDDRNVGLPFYELDFFNNIMNGWAKGTVYLLSAFSGMGKSSFVVYSIIMSCIRQKEKLLIIANEMDIEAYQKLLLVTVIGNPLYDEMKDKNFKRVMLDKGKLSDNYKQITSRAIEWLKENVEDEQLIKFVPLEHYTMENVEKVLRFYKNKGYSYAVIDTCKPSENRGNKERWVQFVDDFEKIYQLAKMDSLDMGIFTTVQNADSYINVKYLDYSAIGDGKKIKNTVDFCCHIRKMFESELVGDKALSVYNHEGKQIKIKFTPMKDKNNYYLLFVSKNRRGETNTNGLPVLVLNVDLNTNSWKEIGFTYVANDLQ